MPRPTIARPLTGLLLWAALLLLLLATAPARSTTQHRNYVYFPGVSDFRFDLNDHYITSGQPWGGIDYGAGSEHGGFVLVYAGRHGSEHAANWFKDRADVAIVTRHTGSYGWPHKLNFAIQGDMYIQGSNGGWAKCEGVLIGQGHKGAYNNWWVGGKAGTMYTVDNRVWLECPPVDGYCGGVILLSTKDSNRFPLSVRTCPPTD